MSLSGTLTLQFRHPERTDAPTLLEDGTRDPDSPCARAELDNGGSVTGASPEPSASTTRAVRVSLTTELLGAGSRATTTGGQGQLTATVRAGFREGDGTADAANDDALTFRPRCAEWLQGLCWIARPWIYPEWNVNASEHEGDNYETDGDGLPLINVFLEEDEDGNPVVELPEGFDLRISWPRGDLRPYLSPSAYGQEITWRPFVLDDAPELHTVGPHYGDDIKRGESSPGYDDLPQWLKDLEDEARTSHWGVRIPVRFLLNSNGGDYSLGPTAEFLLKKDPPESDSDSGQAAFQPRSAEGGVVLLHAPPDPETGELGALDPALEVTQEIFEYAIRDGLLDNPTFDPSAGLDIIMEIMPAYGYCDFELIGWCPGPDFQPGDDITAITPWTQTTITPPKAGIDLVSNPRLSRFNRDPSLFGQLSPPRLRVTVARVEAPAWEFITGCEYNQSAYSSHDRAAMAAGPLTLLSPLSVRHRPVCTTYNNNGSQGQIYINTTGPSRVTVTLTADGDSGMPPAPSWPDNESAWSLRADIYDDVDGLSETARIVWSFDRFSTNKPEKTFTTTAAGQLWFRFDLENYQNATVTFAIERLPDE